MRRFTLSPRRWWVTRAFGRNPLLRLTDRIEAFVIVFAIMVVLAGAPVAGVVGAAVYGSRDRLYIEQEQTRHTVTAAVIETGTTTIEHFSNTTAVRAKWRVPGGERTDWVKTDHAVKVGDHIGIWVNKDGDQANPPTPTSQAWIDAGGVAAGVCFAVALGATAMAAATRSRLNQIRHAQWERELRRLADGGRTNRPH
jgi:hypothetical protein